MLDFQTAVVMVISPIALRDLHNATDAWVSLHDTVLDDYSNKLLGWRREGVEGGMREGGREGIMFNASSKMLTNMATLA